MSAEPKHLTERELQVLELVAWGASRKEVPDLLARKYGIRPISVNTVNNIIANIYAKLSLKSETELSAWYFCEYEGVDRSHSPLPSLKTKVIAVLLLLVLLPQLTNMDQAVRPARTARVTRTRAQRGGRRSSDELDITGMI